jgi:hypothetical protein
MRKQLKLLLLTGWLIPTGVALVFFGRWIREIVIPTLKGGNFDRLYDLYGVKYLDVTLVCTAFAFVWAAAAVTHWARTRVSGVEGYSEHAGRR